MRLAAIVLALSLPATSALADQPLPPPSKVVTCSANGAYCATSQPGQDTIVARSGAAEVLWTIPGWHRSVFVANDGASAVVEYSGLNLVPIDVSLAEPVLRFYAKAGLVRNVTLNDLYSDRSELESTVSHLAWTRGIHMDEHSRLIVELVDKSKAAFDVRTGARVEP